MKLPLSQVNTNFASKLAEWYLKQNLPEIAEKIRRDARASTTGLVDIVAEFPNVRHVQYFSEFLKSYGLDEKTVEGLLTSLLGSMSVTLISKQGLEGTEYEELQKVIASHLPNNEINLFVSPGLATWNRTTSFTHDQKFVELADRHSTLLPIPNWHWNLSVALWAAQHSIAVQGDFVELGVFRGHTTIFLADYLDFASVNKGWWLYDTFEGIPDEDCNDAMWIETSKSTYNSSTYSYEEVKTRFSSFNNINIIKGRVPEIFNTAPPPKQIAFLHVDLNSAKAEVAALEALYQNMTPGGIILFDDFGWPTARAQFDAEVVWAKQMGLHILELPTGQGLLFVK